MVGTGCLGSPAITDEGSGIDVQIPTDDTSFCFRDASGLREASVLVFAFALKLPLRGVYMTAVDLFAPIPCLA